MEQTFITNIEVTNFLNHGNFSIPLSDNERKHLIITGKNGSGKTSLLKEFIKFLKRIEKIHSNSKKEVIQNITFYERKLKEKNISNKDRISYEQILKRDKEKLESFGKTGIRFSLEDWILIKEKYQKNQFLLIYFDAKRNSGFKEPRTIEEVELKEKYTLEEKAGIDFIQYLVNLKANQSFAREENELEEANRIEKWFFQFEEKLREIFEAPDLQLKFDRKSGFNFTIEENGKPSYGFNSLSDGYSAIISIVSELILRMEALNVKNYDMQGIVLIDEIETHLHIALQKKILPFLTSFFPKIQFIVTTYSPFVLQSLENTVVYDLEHKEVIQDMSQYSSEAIVETYFQEDKYSIELKEKLNQYESLLSKKKLTEEEEDIIYDLHDFFENLPKYKANEISLKLGEIELKNKELLNLLPNF